MKVKLFIKLFAVLIIFLQAGQAIGGWAYMTDAYSVDSVESYSQKNIYNFTDAPVVFAEQDRDGTQLYGDIFTRWDSPSGVQYWEYNYSYKDTSDPGFDQFWFIHIDWDNIKETGNWTVLAGNNNPFYQDYLSLNFTVNASVVPEPISSILFITGGGFLGGRRFLRGRK